MRRSIVFLFSVFSLSLGFSPGAYALHAEASKVHISSCGKKVCYELTSSHLQTSQLFPVWSFQKGQLDIKNLKSGAGKNRSQATQSVEFDSATWDEVSQVYELKTRTAVLVFEPHSGQLRSE